MESKKSVDVARKSITEKSYILVTRRTNGSKRVQIFNLDPSRTDESQGDSTDINNIMARYKRDGYLPQFSGGGVYADVSDIPKSLTEAYSMIKQSEETFSKLPSHIRERFRNNPQDMINFLNDPKNLAEAEKMGLVTRIQNKNDDSNDDINPNPTPNPKKTKAPPQKTEPE